MFLNPNPSPDSFWGVIIAALGTLGILGAAYFQYRKPKIDANAVKELNEKVETLQEDKNMLNVTVARLTEQVKSFNKEQEIFEKTLEKLQADHEIKINEAIAQYKIASKSKNTGIFKSTILILSHVSEYVGDQQASLLKDLQKTLQNEIN